ncbi:MAG: MBL fold metallo-hydrolase [Rhodothermales bacterium]|nr:MBL fold metallo-hydrolase [Rhodothermales bacterium]
MAQIGNYQLHSIETGTFGLDGGAMFGVVPRTLWSKRIECDEQNRIPLAMRCLLLESSDRLILIDNGVGHKYSARFRSIFNIDHSASTLEGSLSDKGFSTDDVTDVVLTHLHFDHAGGTTTQTESGLELTFPTARHFIQRAQWESANDPNPREKASFLEENLSPLVNSQNLVLVDGEGEILPGIEVLTANGHTDKMQLVKVSDEDRTLVFVADLIPTVHHFGIPWTMAYDIRPLESMSEKDAFLRRAVDQRWSLFFEHDVTCEVCQVGEGDRGFFPIELRTLNEL